MAHGSAETQRLPLGSESMLPERHLLSGAFYLLMAPAEPGGRTVEHNRLKIAKGKKILFSFFTDKQGNKAAFPVLMIIC